MSSGDLSVIFGEDFQTNSVEPQTDFQVLPPGKYPILIEKAEIKQTKAGTGHYLELTMSVLEGPGQNRKVWSRINIDNPNATAVEIAKRTLAALGLAVGLAAISDTSQLLNKTCIASIKVKNDQNEVRTYLPLAQPTSPQHGPPPQQYAPPQQAPPVPVPPQQQQYAPPASPQQHAQPPQQQVVGKPPWAR